MTKYFDVHHHLLPPFYYDALNKAGVPKKYGIKLPEWSIESSRKVMEKFNIKSAITSISTPGIYIGDIEFSKKLARQCNDYAAELSIKFPKVYGAYVCGDPIAVANITTHVSPATFFGPRGDVNQGAHNVLSTFNQGAVMFRAGSNTNFEILHMAASDSIAYWVGFQRAIIQMQKGDPIPMNLRVTEIFRRENDDWKLIHRHADLLAPKEDNLK